MAGLRLTKAERELLRDWLHNHDCYEGVQAKARNSLLAKLDKLEAPKGTGVDVKDAVKAFQGVLGTRLITPMGAVWGMMQNRIRALGLSLEDCTAIASAAASEWRGPVKAESLVRQAEKLLQGGHSTPVAGRRGALDMGDDL